MGSNALFLLIGFASVSTLATPPGSEIRFCRLNDRVCMTIRVIDTAMSGDEWTRHILEKAGIGGSHGSIFDVDGKID